MTIYIGSIYVFLGLIFLIFPIIYLEIGRPKDLIKAALNLLIGIILIIKNNTFDNLENFVFILIIFLVVLYVLEVFSIRWNQLTDKEKIKLTTFVEFKKNVLKVAEATSFGVDNFKKSFSFIKFKINNENNDKKKWVRNDQNDNIKS